VAVQAVSNEQVYLVRSLVLMWLFRLLLMSKRIPGLIVSLDMAVQAVSSHELFVALVALEWSFPCVGPATQAACQWRSKYVPYQFLRQLFDLIVVSSLSMEVKICTNFLDSCLILLL
jgi:hypothetical protein